MWVLLQVGVTNGVLRGLGGLTKLHTLHIADAYRVTNAGLHFISNLTGACTICGTIHACLHADLATIAVCPKSRIFLVCIPELRSPPKFLGGSLAKI